MYWCVVMWRRFEDLYSTKVQKTSWVINQGYAIFQITLMQPVKLKPFKRNIGYQEVCISNQVMHKERILRCNLLKKREGNV